MPASAERARILKSGEIKTAVTVKGVGVTKGAREAIEAAARTYFGYRYPGCGQGGADPCSSELAPEEAALLAALISSPAAYSPRVNPNDSAAQRNLVLQKMNEQDVLSDEEYTEAAQQQLPPASEIQKPEVDSLAPYYT